MTEFLPGDKVIKRSETDARNYGHVMDIPTIQQKPGYVAVYFARHVWIKPENLMHFDDWRKAKKPTTPKNIKNYWTAKQ